jgi:hypothetical protein
MNIEIPEPIRLAGQIVSLANSMLDKKPDERWKGCGEHCDLVKLSAGTAKMVAPIFLAFHNGGVPVKQTGRYLKTPWGSFALRDVVSMLYHAAFLAVLIWLAVGKVEYKSTDEHGKSTSLIVTGKDTRK